MKLYVVISALMLTTFAFDAYASGIASSDATVIEASQKKPKKKAETKEVTFNVHLHCANCVKKVQENIAFEKGVKGLEVSLENQTVYIKYDSSKTSESTLRVAIESLGYPVVDSAASGHDQHDHQHN